jgi:hypothetical protein
VAKSKWSYQLPHSIERLALRAIAYTCFPIAYTCFPIANRR